MSPALVHEAQSERESELRWALHLREHEQRFADVERTRLIHSAAHEREHESTQVAIDKQEAQVKEWRAAANEWRAAMNDREANFAGRADLAAVIRRIDELVAQNNVRLAKFDTDNATRDERERLRSLTEAEERRQDERRQSRQQWVMGIAVTIVSITIGVLLKLIP